MSIPHSLLALLSDQPMHGYGLKTRFEETTVDAWPLNVGQVYTTLRRLERDGLAQPKGGGEASQQLWKITTGGRGALTDWFHAPVAEPNRSELIVKVLLAVATKRKDLKEILDQQRVATMSLLQRYTKLKKQALKTNEVTWLLAIDAMIFKAESELKWLDQCENRTGIA